MRHVVGLLLGALIAIYAVSADAKSRSKETKKQETAEQIAEKQKRYDACVASSKEIENAYYLALPHGRLGNTQLDASEYLFRAYLRTVKWDDHGCFEWKDSLAAKKMNMTLREYVIGGMHPELRERLLKLFVALEAKECREGVACKPGITSGFRDNFRQDIAEGYKASTCKSMHGGSCRTRGWGDGRAVDVVNVSDFDVGEKERWAATEKIWSHIDEIGRRFGIYRPMRSGDPMHLEPTGSLKAQTAAAAKEKNKEIADRSAEPQKNVKKKKKYVKKKREKR